MQKQKDSSLIAFFIFYKVASGVQAKLAFNEKFRHCNCVVYDGRDWIMLDFDSTGFLVRRIKVNEPNSFIRSLHVIPDITAIVGVSVVQRKKIAWKPFLVRSCNEICRYTAGIDLGFTFNPIHFYKKLLDYRHNRNYEIISHWRRKDGNFRRR